MRPEGHCIKMHEKSRAKKRKDVRKENLNESNPQGNCSGVNPRMIVHDVSQCSTCTTKTSPYSQPLVTCMKESTETLFSLNFNRIFPPTTALIYIAILGYSNIWKPVL